MSQLKTINNNTKKIITKKKKTITNLTSHKIKKKKIIQTFQTKIIKHINNLKKTLKKKFNKLHKKKINHIQQNIKIFKQKLQNINYYKNLLNTTTKNIPPLTILTKKTKIKQQYQLLKKNIQHKTKKIIKTQYKIKKTNLISKIPNLKIINTKHTTLHSNKTINHLQLSPKLPIQISKKKHNFLTLKYQNNFISNNFTINKNLILINNKNQKIQKYSKSKHKINTQIYPIYKNPFNTTLLPNKKNNYIITITLPIIKTIQLLKIKPKSLNIINHFHFKSINQYFNITFINNKLLITYIKSINI